MYPYYFMYYAYIKCVWLFPCFRKHTNYLSSRVQLQSSHTYYVSCHAVCSNWLIVIEFVECVIVVAINSDWQVTNCWTV